MQQIMLKDKPVLEVENYNVKILDYDHLPVALRYEDVNYDDIFHGWTETRMMNIGKSNAKKILNALRVSQNNLYTIAKALHFVSVTDCYWINEDEKLTWDDVNLYKNPYNEDISEIALFGTEKRITIPLEKLHTPEIATQGMAAKAWIWERDGLYLYKIGKAELTASEILEALGIEHVPYYPVNAVESSLLNERQIKRMQDSRESIVKCRCLCDETTSIISWEDFAIYADRNGINDFEFVAENFPKAYYNMIAADYILGNDDRHVGNWGFWVNNDTGKIIRPYPLMDHDHAFNNEKLYCQTMEHDIFLEDAAKMAIIKEPISLSVLQDKKPDTISETDWDFVLKRVSVLEQERYRTAKQKAGTLSLADAQLIKDYEEQQDSDKNMQLQKNEDCL